DPDVARLFQRIEDLRSTYVNDQLEAEELATVNSDVENAREIDDDYFEPAPTAESKKRPAPDFSPPAMSADEKAELTKVLQQIALLELTAHFAWQIEKGDVDLGGDDGHDDAKAAVMPGGEAAATDNVNPDADTLVISDNLQNLGNDKDLIITPPHVTRDTPLVTPAKEARPVAVPAGNALPDEEKVEEKAEEPVDDKKLDALTPCMQSEVRASKKKKLRKLMSRKLKGKRVMGKKMRGKKRWVPSGDDAPAAEHEALGDEEPVEPEIMAPSIKRRRKSRASSSWEARELPDVKPASTKPKAKPKAVAKGKAKASAMKKPDADEETKPASTKPKAKPKAKAKGKAKAKASAVKKPDADEDGKPVSTKPKAEPKAKAKGKAKAKASAGGAKRAQPDAKDVADDGAAEGEARLALNERRQGQLWLTDNKWTFKIIPGQYYGCKNCRFLYYGCKSCQKESFRGVRAAEYASTDEEYLWALSQIDETGEVDDEWPEHNGDDTPEAPPTKPKKDPKKKAKTSKD
ncbi:unnamed protein product, partial [Symbiodinium sp. KB8]